MSFWHGYIGIENLNLTNPQKAQLFAAIQALPPPPYENDGHEWHYDGQVACLNHWRIRLDNDAAIFEAHWNEDHISIPVVKGWLANIFEIDPGDIGHSTQTVSFGGGTTSVVTFSYADTDRLRMALFGGLGSTRDESNVEAQGYIYANAAEWGEEE